MERFSADFLALFVFFVLFVLFVVKSFFVIVVN